MIIILILANSSTSQHNYTASQKMPPNYFLNTRVKMFLVECFANVFCYKKTLEKLKKTLKNVKKRDKNKKSKKRFLHLWSVLCEAVLFSATSVRVSVSVSVCLCACVSVRAKKNWKTAVKNRRNVTVIYVMVNIKLEVFIGFWCYVTLNFDPRSGAWLFRSTINRKYSEGTYLRQRWPLLNKL